MIAVARVSLTALRAERGAADASKPRRTTETAPRAHTAKQSWESRIIDSDAITVERRGRRGPGYANGFVRHESLLVTRPCQESPPWQLPCVRARARDAHGRAPRPAHRLHRQAPEFLSGPARELPSAACVVWTQPHNPPRCISLPEANSCAPEQKLVPRPKALRRALRPASERS